MSVAGYTLIKFFRGDSSEVQSVIPEQGEPIVDLSTNKLYIGDGRTSGGRFIGPFQPGLLGFQKVTASSNTNALAWQIINVKTAGGAVDLTLPTTPNIGDQIRIVDGTESFNSQDCTLLRNGSRINGIESNLDLTTVGQYLLYYGNNGSNDTWFIFPIIGEKWFDQGIEKDDWNVIGKSAAYTATNNDNIMCDTTGGPFVLTTPASPELGDLFQVQDWKNNFNTANLTITPNSSQTIGSLSSNLTLSSDDQVVTLMYDIDSLGNFTWRVKYGRDNNDIIGGASDVKNSLEIDSGALQLVGDALTPGADKYYGTNSSGTKGFFDVASGSGDLTATADKYADLLNNSQYMNCSFDNFTDETLVNTGTTTMTYNSGNNQYAFTTGQVLESADLYDSSLSTTIEECMVSVEYTGPGTIQVTADGGSNWETTSSNEIHTFTNTGSDIRVRFTASGSGVVDDWGILCIPDTGASAIGPAIDTDAVPINWISKTVADDGYTAIKDDAIMCDTSGGSFTINLPAIVERGDTIHFIDAASTFDTNSCWIGRNGHVIMGLAENLELEEENLAMRLVYDNPTNGWRLVTIVGSTETAGSTSNIKTVTNHATSPVTITDDDSDKVKTNSGATGAMTFNLDSSLSIGSHIIFAKAESDYDLIVSVPAGAYIGDSTSGGQIINDTDGQASATISILKISSEMYSIVSGWGTWTTS